MQRISSSLGSRLLAQACSSSAAPRFASTANIPAGHLSSDLSSTACNIGLSRRRDISLRQDVTVHVDGKPANLADVFRGNDSLVIGLPDCGKVCKEKHVPDYVHRIQELRDAGFANVLISSVTSPEKLQKFMDETGASKAGIKALADTGGGLTRMLGLEVNEPGSQPPYSHRYTVFVQDGILVRTCVEKGPEYVDKAGVKSSLAIIAGLFA